MHVLFTPRRRRSTRIALGAALVVVSLTGCGDDASSATAERQVEAADRIYRADHATSSTSGNRGGSWWWGSGSGGSSDSSEGSGGTHRSGDSSGSQRGGFGSSGHHFSFGS